VILAVHLMALLLIYSPLAPGKPDWFWFYITGTVSPGYTQTNPESHKMVAVVVVANKLKTLFMLASIMVMQVEQSVSCVHASVCVSGQ